MSIVPTRHTDLDCVHLAQIAGDDYYEIHQVLRVRGEERLIVGRASDWPLIAARAEIAELKQLLEATQQQAAESERHCQELIARNQALSAATVPPAVAAAATGMPEGGGHG